MSIFSRGAQSTLVPEVNRGASTVLDSELRVASVGVVAYTQYAACWQAGCTPLGSNGLSASLLVGQRVHILNSLTRLACGRMKVPCLPRSARMRRQLPECVSERSRHLPQVRRPEAPGGRLGRRAASHRRAAHVHRRPHHPVGQGLRRGKQQARRLPAALHAATSRSPWWRRRPSYKTAGDGLQQAKEYAEILGLKFAYATNGTEIVEFDYLTGRERRSTPFPTPAELWRRLRAGRCAHRRARS